MDIADLAFAPDLILSAGSPLLAAVQQMRTRGIECAPVIDAQERLVGELRIRRAADSLQHSYAHNGPVLVGSAMAWDVQTVCSRTSPRAAQNRMQQRKLESVYVVSSELRLLGVLLRTHLDRAAAGCEGCPSDPSQHGNCRGRWCRHAGFCANADKPSDAANSA